MEKRIRAEYAEKKAKWLQREGFNKEGYTWIYIGADSYERKDQLKEAGFKFNSSLLWHIGKEDAGFEPVIKLSTADLEISFSAWGEGTYDEQTRGIVNGYVEELVPASTSQYVGQEKEKLTDYPAVLKSIKEIDTMYGPSQIVTFVDEDGNVLTWFTKVVIEPEIGSDVLISGTIKTHKEFRNEKQTVLTRVKIKELY